MGPFLAILLLGATPGYASDGRHEVGAGKAARAAGKPFVYFQSNKGGDLAGARAHEVERLRACGFDVHALSIEKEELPSFDYHSLPPGTPFFVGATHGSRSEKSNALVLDSDGHKVEIGPILSKLSATSPGSSVWVGTCHAGLCRTSGCKGLGTACSAQQKNWSLADNKSLYIVDNLLISLYCDSIAGCKEWKKFDGDHDGVLNGNEINRYMIKALTDSGSGGGNRRILSQAAYKNWTETLADRARCESKKGILDCSVEFNAKVEVQTGAKKLIVVPVQELEPAGLKLDDIAVRRSPSEVVTKYSQNVELMLQGKLPDPFDEETVRILRGSAALSEGTLERISETALECSTGRGKTKQTKRFHFLGIEPRPGAKGPIVCECLADEQIPFYNEGAGNQQIYFDPEFRITCQGT